jgi:uncharacterized membrane-anchored protein
MRSIIAIAIATLAFSTAGHAAPKPENVQECKSIDQQLQSLEAESRKAQSGPAQDSLRARQKTVRDRQFELKC